MDSELWIDPTGDYYDGVVNYSRHSYVDDGPGPIVLTGDNLQDNHYGCNVLASVGEHYANHSSGLDEESEMQLKMIYTIAYGYISPCIITCGIFGDIMTVFILTHPILKRASVIYTYLTFLAITDLCTQLSIVPMIMLLADYRFCSYAAAWYYAHAGFPLVNAFMATSVWIVVSLTFNQFLAICYPFYFADFRSRKTCFWLTGLLYLVTFIIYAPYGAKKSVCHDPQPNTTCEYFPRDNPAVDGAEWFKAYAWGREAYARFIPFVLVAYFNISILLAYQNTKRDRLIRTAGSQRRTVRERSEREEKRLLVLLLTIVTIFFVCTIPAAVLAVLVRDKLDKSISFQLLRAIINTLEFTKFAMNFYVYCLINPDIRRVFRHVITCTPLNRPARVQGQNVNPLSKQLAPSTKTSTLRSSRRSRSHTVEDENRERKNSILHAILDKWDGRRKSTAGNGMQMRATSLKSTDQFQNGAYEHLTVIRESDMDCCPIGSPDELSCVRSTSELVPRRRHGSDSEQRTITTSATTNNVHNRPVFRLSDQKQQTSPGKLRDTCTYRSTRDAVRKGEDNDNPPSSTCVVDETRPSSANIPPDDDVVGCRSNIGDNIVDGKGKLLLASKPEISTVSVVQVIPASINESDHGDDEDEDDTLSLPTEWTSML